MLYDAIFSNRLHGFQLGLALHKRHLMVRRTLHFITNAIGLTSLQDLQIYICDLFSKA